jgi:type IV secretory pathway protease TraF
VSDDAATARPGLKLDTTVSHSARIWNYWLGGKDNFAVDREAGDRVAAMLPSIVAQARADRGFLGRAIRYLCPGRRLAHFRATAGRTGGTSGRRRRPARVVPDV